MKTHILKTIPHLQPLQIALVVSVFATQLVPAASYVWDAGGGANTAYNTVANWDPTAPTGGPGNGDIATVGGTYAVGITTAGMIPSGVNLTLNDSSSLVRNSTAFFTVPTAAVITFNNSSTLKSSGISLGGNATLNWNSAGSWTTVGASTPANFATTAGGSQVISMSAGLWSLVGNTHATDSFTMNAGTFNMSGGVIFSDKRFTLGATSTFNLGGSSSVYMNSDFMAPGAKMNFVGTDSAYYTKSDFLTTRITAGRIYVDGVLQSDDSKFDRETVLVDEALFGGTGGSAVSYFKYSIVVPEPSGLALAVMGLVAGALRRRRHSSHC